MIAAVSTSLTLAAGAFMTVADHDNFPSIGSGLWWAVQTVTTVGYGDHVPATLAGRVVATLVMLAGIGFLTVITAAITSSLRVMLPLRSGRRSRATLRRGSSSGRWTSDSSGSKPRWPLARSHRVERAWRAARTPPTRFPAPTRSSQTAQGRRPGCRTRHAPRTGFPVRLDSASPRPTGSRRTVRAAGRRV